MFPVGREDRHAAGTGAVNAARAVNLHAVGHAILGGRHAGKHPAVAERTVGGHVVRADVLILFDLAAPVLVRRFTEGARVGHIQDRFIG